MLSQSPTPTISVVICTRNRPGDVALCLPTVMACAYPCFDVIVIDQSDNSQTEEVIRGLGGQDPRLAYFHTPSVGKSRALNLGLGMATGELIAFTDDDCEALPGWLQAIADVFVQDAAVDIAFGPVLPSPTLGDLSGKMVPCWSFETPRPLGSTELCGMGANMALRRRILEILPKGDIYDPRLGPGAPFPAAEEGDMSYRLRKRGARAVLRPAMQLYHRAYRTPDQWNNVLFGYGRGDAAFWLKHARCGDRWAMWMLLRHLACEGARESAKLILRRSHKIAYIAGFWDGLSKSRQIPIDREKRLYRGE